MTILFNYLIVKDYIRYVLYNTSIINTMTSDTISSTTHDKVDNLGKVEPKTRLGKELYNMLYVADLATTPVKEVDMLLAKKPVTAIEKQLHKQLSAVDKKLKYDRYIYNKKIRYIMSHFSIKYKCAVYMHDRVNNAEMFSDDTHKEWTKELQEAVILLNTCKDVDYGKLYTENEVEFLKKHGIHVYEQPLKYPLDEKKQDCHRANNLQDTSDNLNDEWTTVKRKPHTYLKHLYV